MNGEDPVESITDLSDQNFKATAEQALVVECMTPVDPLLSGVLLSQEDHGLKRKHCEVSGDSEVGKKKVRFLENVSECETNEVNCESVLVSTKLSATLRASFSDESNPSTNGKEADEGAIGNLPEVGKKGKRRKRGQRKIRTSENLKKMEEPSQQTSMESRILESNECRAFITQVVEVAEDNVTNTEKMLENNEKRTLITPVTEYNITNSENMLENNEQRTLITLVAEDSVTNTEKMLENNEQKAFITSVAEDSVTNKEFFLENNEQRTLITPVAEGNVHKTENSVPDKASFSSRLFTKLTGKPRPMVDNFKFKPFLSKPKPQEIIKPIVSPTHQEEQQPNTKKVVNDLSCLKFQSGEKSSKSEPSPSEPKRREEVYMYGNYSRYYGYRSPVLEEDVRLSCFSQSFFEGKDVLDIGCNIGHVTLLIARDWKPKGIVGLDIDGKLISVAKKNVKHYICNNSRYGLTSKSASQSMSNNGNSFNSVLPHAKLFPNNVMFMQGNYVLARDDLVKLQKEEYDVVLALSISKWIHLNFGDDGLKRTFQRVYKQLRPGGKFVLEPQEWSSYKRKKKLTETIFENFKNIRFRPDSFRNYLLSDDVGFSSCELLGIPNNKSKGFRRPLLMFTKGSSENQNENLIETEQQSKATNEHQVHLSTSTCSANAMTESNEFQSPISQNFSQVANIDVCDKTESVASTLNATDIQITQGTLHNEDHAVSTCLRDGIETGIIHSGELQSAGPEDFSGVANTLFHDNSVHDDTASVNVIDILSAKGARHEDTSELTCLTDTMVEGMVFDSGEVQSPNLQDSSAAVNTLVDSETEGSYTECHRYSGNGQGSS